jgi:uncharacterized repeat protein (TIGR01451 family)
MSTSLFSIRALIRHHATGLAWLVACVALSGPSAPAPAQSLKERFSTDPIPAGRFIQETDGSESWFCWNSTAQNLTAVLDVDESPAFYLSQPFAMLSEVNDMSFSVRFRVDAIDDQYTPTAFIGLMMDQHVECSGDGLTLLISTPDGKPAANANIDAGSFRASGKQVILETNIEYLAVGFYIADTRTFSIEIFKGAGFNELVGFSTVSLPPDQLLRLNRLGLQNSGCEKLDRNVGSITLTVDDLCAPGGDSNMISILDPVPVREGNQGTTPLIFEVQLHRASSQPVSVRYATVEGTAKAGRDYVGTNGIVTFEPGETRRTIAVQVIGDLTRETSEEVFQVQLTNPERAVLSRAEATGRIMDDDPYPSLFIQNATVIEPDLGVTNAIFTVTLTATAELDVTVRYDTTDGTANGGAAPGVGIDYQRTNGVLKFAPGLTNATLPVPVYGDGINETNETFFVNLSSPTNAVLGNSLGVGTIHDYGLWLSINDASVVEGNSGATNMIFIVSVSRPHSAVVAVDYATANGTAIVGQDLYATSGSLTFSPSETSKEIKVPVVGDAIPETDETFYVNLSNPFNAPISRAQGVGTIRNDDPYPRLSIGNVSLEEGNTGTNAVFEVRLSENTNLTVAVDYATSDGTAKANADYTATSGKLVFAPGTSSVQSISVPVVGDRVDEFDEVFYVNLSNPTPSLTLLEPKQGVATILDDDDPPAIQLSNLGLPEGNTGTTAFTFPITLSAASGKDVTVSYSTADGTAKAADSDYVPIPLDRLTFPAGTTAQTITVLVKGDTRYEPDELFYVNFFSPGNAALPGAQVVGTLLNDDPKPAVSINDVTVIERPGGTNAIFTLTLSNPSSEPLTVYYATLDGTAIASSDYVPAQGQVMFPAGSITTNVVVKVLDDDLHEDDETCQVVLSLSSDRATLARDRGTATIRDNDPASITINDVSIPEGDSGTYTALFTVTLSNPSSHPITVNFTTSDGTAQAPADYRSASGVLTFPTNTTEAVLSVVINGDLETEANETFYVNLNNPSPSCVTLARPRGVGTILDDDDRTLSILDAVPVLEGDSGTTTQVVFTVTLSNASATNVTVRYDTQSGTATGGADFQSTTGELVFSRDTTTQEVRVWVIGDDTVEDDETFFVKLSSPVNARLDDLHATATGLILDDDRRELSIDSVPVWEGRAGTTTQAVFTVRLSKASQNTITVRYDTQDGSATGGSDYLPTNGVLTFPPGATTQPIRVVVIGDDLTEPNETFFVKLSNPTNAILSMEDHIGTGTILDDDLVDVCVAGLSLLTEDCPPGNGAIDPWETVTVDLRLVNCGTALTTNLVVTLLATNGVAPLSEPQMYGVLPTDGAAVARPFTFVVDGPCGGTNTVVFHLQDGPADLGLVSTNLVLGTAVDGKPVCCYSTDVAIQATAAPEPVLVGQNLAYTIVVTNRGPALAPNVTVTNRLGKGLNYVSSHGGQGCSLISSNLMSWSLGDLPPGDAVTLTLIAAAQEEGAAISLFRVYAPVDDPDTDNNIAVVTSTIERPVGISIGNVSVVEGDAGVINAVFKLWLSPAIGRTVTVDCLTSDGTATAGLDYETTSGLVSFAPGATVATFVVPVRGDVLWEPDETFFVKLSNPVGAPLATNYSLAVGTIINDDLPCVSIGDANIHGLFEVSLSCPSSLIVTVPYETADGTAVAGRDYVAAKGSLTFAPGETNNSITVQLINNPQSASTNCFYVKLGTPTNAKLCRDKAVACITNAGPPILTIADATVWEGNSGATTASFKVTLSAASTQAVAVEYNTANGTAWAGSDYSALVHGWLEMPPGTIQTNIDVLVYGDRLAECDETFFIKLSNPQNALIARTNAVGMIKDDDYPAHIVADQMVLLEENCMPTNRAIDPLETVRVSLALRNTGCGPARNLIATLVQAGGVVPLSGPQNYTNLAPNHSDARPFTFLVEGECGETFLVSLRLQDGTNDLGNVIFPGTLGLNLDGQFVCCTAADLAVSMKATPTTAVLDQPLTYTLTITNLGPSTATRVGLTNRLGAGLKLVSASSSDGRFTSANDLIFWSLDELKAGLSAEMTVVTIPTTNSLGIVTTIARAAAAESDPNPANNIAVLATQVNPPTGISISGAIAAEGADAAAVFAVRLYPQSSRPVSVDYRTIDGTAMAGTDYVFTNGTLSFTSGNTLAYIKVPIIDDEVDEPEEAFFVQLSNPAGAVLAGNQAAGIIRDNDPPAISIDDVTVNVGLIGDTIAILTVSLSSTPTNVVAVDYRTVNGAATEGTDYNPVQGTLRFTTNGIAVTNLNIVILIAGNTLDEGVEQFYVQLSNPTNATLAKDRGIVTITDEATKPLLTIAPATVLEGDQGYTNAAFQVSLSRASRQAPVLVDYYTTNGTAQAEQDYVATTGHVRFELGETNKMIVVPVIGDRVAEANETFFVRLANPSSCTLSNAVVIGTILDDDRPYLSINDVTVKEGDSGTTDAVFKVSLSLPSEQVVTVDYYTTNGTAKAGEDYSAVKGMLTFSPLQTTNLIVVPVIGDRVSEASETFFVNLANAVNSAVSQSQGTGTIVDDDPTYLSIGDVRIKEGDAGMTNAVFAISLSLPSEQVVTVDYYTTNGTAKAGEDYVGVTNTVKFQPGQTLTNIVVLVIGDQVAEGNETFFVNLTNQVHAAVALGQGVGEVQDDDQAKLSITGVSVQEGDSGTTNAVFKVSLSLPSEQVVTVDYYTTNGTAKAGEDYSAVKGMLTFSPLQTTNLIVVPVIGDRVSEASETFFVNLANAVNSAVSQSQGTGTIVDDDPTYLSIGDVRIKEGDAGMTNAVFAISLSLPSEQVVTVDYYTTNGTAKAGEDYVGVTNTVKFQPGQTLTNIVVLVIGDQVAEGNETFFVNLTNQVHAAVALGQGVGEVQDDDQAKLSITGVSVQEGDSGTTNAVFTVRLSVASDRDVMVVCYTADGSARVGEDYIGATTTLIFKPGETERPFPVQVIGDRIAENDESFLVKLANPVNAPIEQGQATGEIRDDDQVRVYILDASVKEGDSGMTNAVVWVGLSGASQSTVTVELETADGTAKAWEDYGPAKGTLVFAPGETGKEFLVTVIGDRIAEDDETFFVRLAHPSSGTLNRSVATVTILDDDPTYLSIGDVKVQEGDSGTTDAVFTVSLSLESEPIVTVHYKTADGTAKAGEDYVAVEGMLTFATKETRKTVAVPIIGDRSFEPDETFFVDLTGEVHAGIQRPRGVGTIVDDEDCPASVLLASPVDRTCFQRGETVLMTAVPIGGLEKVTRVEFYVSPTPSGEPLVATVFYPDDTGSFVFTNVWYEPNDYVLMAKVHCINGETAISDPVRIRVSDNPTQVAIVPGVKDDPEIAAMQDYLWEMELCSQVFEREGLTYEKLYGFDLIIWDDLGNVTKPLTDNEVDVFYRAWTNNLPPRNSGIPLYLIGENLLSAVTNLHVTQRAQWLDLIHLSTTQRRGSCGRVEVLHTEQRFPIVRWSYGFAEDFAYTNQIDLGMVTTGEGEPLAWCGATPVLVASPGPRRPDYGEVRIVTQALRLVDGGDDASAIERKKLFQNAVCWVLRTCADCPSVEVVLDPTFQQVPDRGYVGEALTYTETLLVGGECLAMALTWTNLLSPSVMFSSATSSRGTPCYDRSRHMVMLYLPSMHGGEENKVLMTVTVVPQRPGEITNFVGVAIKDQEVRYDNNSLEFVTLIEGLVEQPVLGIVRAETGYELRLSGQAGQWYAIQRSVDLNTWFTLRKVSGPEWTVRLWEIADPKASRQFFRAFSPPD